MLSPINRRSAIRIITLFVICNFAFAISYAQADRDVRVLIIEDASSLRLKIKGPYEVTDSISKNVLIQGENLNTTVTVYGGGIQLGNTMAKTSRLIIKPHYSEPVIINGRALTGSIQLIIKNAKLSAVNHINLEDYVKGISVREISHYWPVESLKAEVIAFRTFALYKMQENAGKDFDLTSDVYSQVYSGRAAERYRINKAVDETSGLILTYVGKNFPTFYHATCGGHTEDASLFWNIDIAPLKGAPCSFCQDSPHFKWHNVLSKKEVKEALKKANYKIEDLKDIIILGRDKSGRITGLKLVTDKKEIKIQAMDFRNALGPNIIKSTNFELKIIDQDIVFEGLGWGHGVGLCQWGGYFMAKHGYTYGEILEHYYPGTRISSLTEPLAAK